MLHNIVMLCKKNKKQGCLGNISVQQPLLLTVCTNPECISVHLSKASFCTSERAKIWHPPPSPTHSQRFLGDDDYIRKINLHGGDDEDLNYFLVFYNVQ